LEVLFSKQLGSTRLFVKRDDHMALGGGGNKVRKLEFLIGEALAQGADTLMTVGGLQSNHARLTAAAAAKAGLACELVLSQMVPRDGVDYIRGGNVLLDRLFGARVVTLSPGEDRDAFLQARVAELAAGGRKVHFAPTGGSSPVGCLGYAQCAAEILRQADERGVKISEIVLPNGSSGTHAGLLAGLAAMGASVPVRAHAVLATREVTVAATLEKARATAALLDTDVQEADVVVDDAQRGDGYGLPTDEMRTAVRLLARTEGLLLDPVYSGKAFAGFLHDIRRGTYHDAGDVVFLMTGGTPGLFAYRLEFDEEGLPG
jgi:D-cysteine desulfhydrase